MPAINWAYQHSIKRQLAAFADFIVAGGKR
jgi:hypothetical protein